MGGAKVEEGRGDVVGFLTLFLHEQRVVIIIICTLVQTSALFSMPREGPGVPTPELTGTPRMALVFGNQKIPEPA